MVIPDHEPLPGPDEARLQRHRRRMGKVMAWGVIGLAGWFGWVHMLPNVDPSSDRERGGGMHVVDVTPNERLTTVSHQFGKTVLKLLPPGDIPQAELTYAGNAVTVPPVSTKVTSGDGREFDVELTAGFGVSNGELNPNNVLSMAVDTTYQGETCTGIRLVRPGTQGEWRGTLFEQGNGHRPFEATDSGQVASQIGGLLSGSVPGSICPQ